MKALVVVMMIGGASSAAPHVTKPPAALVKDWKLSPSYVKYLDAGGMPILGSATVSDYALYEAAYLVDRLVGKRPELLAAIAKQHIRLVVMAKTEMTTDVAEHADLTPKAYWDKRARGIGATAARPATSAAEENLLNLEGDPYAAENILVHEFAHVVHLQAMAAVDPTFDGRLRAAYAHAKEHGLWANTYAMTNAEEYWAEGAQSWFDTNRVNDSEHGPIATRALLKPYDPDLAKLLAEVYGDGAWRYQKIAARPASERAHLVGLDRAKLGKFVWPVAVEAAAQAVSLHLEAMTSPIGKRVTPQRTTPATTLTFHNGRASAVEIDWVSFDGHDVKYATLEPGRDHVQATFEGHVWIVREAGGARAPLGILVAPATPGRVDIE